MDSFKKWFTDQQRLDKQKRVIVKPAVDRLAMSPWHQQKKMKS
jgi:hypothetical protein